LKFREIVNNLDCRGIQNQCTDPLLRCLKRIVFIYRMAFEENVLDAFVDERCSKYYDE
jgi:hypothetical protein